MHAAGRPLVCALALCAGPVLADEYTHRYRAGEELKLWTNKVGPYHNPQETYLYHSLPLCSGTPVEQLEHRWDALGEVLEGNDLINSDFDIRFGTPIHRPVRICSMVLGESVAAQLQYAVNHHYWYQFYLDDLPIWGMVGELASEADGLAARGGQGLLHEHDEPLIYTHKKFSIAYNRERIIAVNLTSENAVPLRPGATLDFTYSVEWAPSPVPFHRRFDRYLDYGFFEHQIHWFSIFNSFMMVVFLTGIVSLILMRTLRKDYAKYAREAADLEALDDELDESGWKQVHCDVFRPPQQLCLFCALVGTGAQLASTALLMILFAMATTLYMGRGTIIVSILCCFALLSSIAGYVSGALYSRLGGRQWTRCLGYTAALFPGVSFAVVLALNMLAVCYSSLAAIPFTSILCVVLIWAFVACPLCLAGTLLGRNCSGTASFPCRVNAIPRLIPDKRWYARPAVLVALGGILPFGSIFIEMYFIFTSFWNYKFYYVYGFMLLVFLILTIVVVCVSIVVTYFLLNNEDYRWPWTSFLSACATAAYVFLYAVYYFVAKTKMEGLLQTSYYFGYTSLLCLGLGAACGCIGYCGCAVFVRRIYAGIKID